MRNRQSKADGSPRDVQRSQNSSIRRSQQLKPKDDWIERQAAKLVANPVGSLAISSHKEGPQESVVMTTEGEPEPARIEASMILNSESAVVATE